jgi:hypothetical protein
MPISSAVVAPWESDGDGCESFVMRCSGADHAINVTEDRSDA